MKIKRFNNLWTMGLILSAVILGAIYLLKIFMPHFVIGVAHIDRIVEIGHYIDTHKWAWYLASTVFSLFSYYFICCACCRKKNLKTNEILIIIITILLLYVIKEFLPNLYTPINMCSIILLPTLFKAEIKSTTFVFCSVTILQAITLEIRNIALMIIDFNFATLTILMIDIYILEVLLYLLFNYEKESQ